MKVVINSCYGGFGLSTEAMKRAVAEGAKGVKELTETEYCGGSLRKEKMKAVGDGYSIAEYLPDVLYKNGMVYTHTDYDDSVRACPILVKIVEEMGGAASGNFAELRVVEIPDDIEWEISEYDGYEHIAEKHQTWG